MVHPVRWYDRERKSSCDFRRTVDGKMRCLPTYESIGDTFEDEACTEPINPKRCGAAPQVFIRTKEACSDELQVFEVGARVEKASIYRRHASRCVKEYVAPFAYRAGAEVAPTSFVSATEVDR